jgi:POT family proton-dependent oligopeptide transporter
MSGDIPLDTGTPERRRLFPDGAFSIVVAAALERFGYFALMSSLMIFMIESLDADHEVVGNLYMGFFFVAFFLPMLGGLIGDFVGHRWTMIFGTVFTGIGLVVLALPTGNEPVLAWAVVLLGLLLLAAGRGLFPVSAIASLAHLYEHGPCRVPAAGSFTVLHVAINLVALPAPLLVNELRDSIQYGLDLDMVEAYRLTFLIALQPVIGALIVVATRGRLFAGAEAVVRDKVRAKDPSPLPDGAVRYTVGALVAVLIAYFLFNLAYSHTMSALRHFGFEFLRYEHVVLEELFSAFNPLVVVVLGPLIAIVYTVVARRRPLPLLPLMAIGMAAVTSGIGLFMLGLGDTSDSLRDLTPSWLDGGPPIGTAMLALFTLSLGEILVFPLVSAVVVSTASRRFRGLLVGVTFMVGGFAGQLDHLLRPVIEGAPVFVELGPLVALGVLACVLTAVFGLTARRQD